MIIKQTLNKGVLARGQTEKKKKPESSKLCYSGGRSHAWHHIKDGGARLITVFAHNFNNGATLYYKKNEYY